MIVVVPDPQYANRTMPPHTAMRTRAVRTVEIMTTAGTLAAGGEKGDQCTRLVVIVCVVLCASFFSGPCVESVPVATRMAGGCIAHEWTGRPRCEAS